MHKYLNILGLAYRAQKLSTGEHSVLNDIQNRQAKLILLASDIGKQTEKKITDKCHSFQIPYHVVDDRHTIGHAIGKQSRVVIAILDKGFAKKIESLLL